MSSSKIEQINSEFKLPIYYNPKKKELKQNIVADLELIQSIIEEDKHKDNDNDQNKDNQPKTMYDFVFQPSHCFSKKIMEQMPTFYTTDTDFLKDSQTLLQQYKEEKEKENNTKPIPTPQEMLDLWDEIKNDTGFKEKYLYLDWKFCEHLNYSETFLEIMSLYNLASPVISLLVPFLFLIIPFFIIQMKGIQLSWSEYTKVLYFLASHHALGRMLTDFHSVSFQQKFYLVVSAGFYLFSIYQNILICIRFKNNMKKIHDHLAHVKAFAEQSIERMDAFLQCSHTLPTYMSFNQECQRNKAILAEFVMKLQKVTPFSYHPKKMAEFGSVLKLFYECYDNDVYNKAFLYSFGFHGYVDSIQGMQAHLSNKKMHLATFLKKPRKNKFKQSYYAALMHKKPIKNDIDLQKNIIITGPNASGKTTVLKATLINIVLTQQWGCGFYKGAQLYPYDHIHCYLNIPDTSGRDSLFQAEARRCKDILDWVDKHKRETHFCIFDELFSGTNPDEAVTSATAFMKYLTANKNVNCLLTTHFVDICKKLQKNAPAVVDNFQMEVDQTDKQNFAYTYLLKKGISTVKGGCKVLREMNYPAAILQETTQSEP